MLVIHRPWELRDGAPAAPTAADDLRNIEEDLQNARKRLELVIDGTNDGIWDWDVHQDKVFWSDRVHQLLGLRKDELGSDFTRFRALMHPQDRDEFNKGLRRHLVYNSPFDMELRIGKEGEEWRFFLIRGKVKRDGSGEAVRMAGSLSDVTLRKRAEEELRYNAYHDALTRLPNRAYFLEALERLTRDALERTDSVFALLLLNPDNFKLINDNLGVVAGDRILIEVAHRLLSVLKSQEVVARLGSDEFAVVIRDIRQAGDATSLASRLREEMAQPFLVDGREVYLTLSVGVVFFSEEYRRIHNELLLDLKDEKRALRLTVESLFQDLNTVLSQAKAKGNARLEVFTAGSREREKKKYHLRHDLQRALENDQIYLCYQPIVRIADRKPAGFEALARWRHPDGDIPPSIFIPIAEEAGMILPIGEWILRAACAQGRRWLEMGFREIVISVNVSAPQFAHQDIPTVVGRILRETGLPAKNLKIEITESVAMHDADRTVETLGRLARMGMEIAIDDFGTGYSNFSYIQKYPTECLNLKIDQSFVREIPREPRGVAIASTIVDMAHNLGMPVIAEGVETEEQFRFFEAKGVAYAQGFYFSRPLRVEEAEDYLRTHLVPTEVVAAHAAVPASEISSPSAPSSGSEGA
jgi:diguanylate cyclase (GGDEF)-like protein/PAS domain S-box-containing protein